MNVEDVLAALVGMGLVVRKQEDGLEVRVMLGDYIPMSPNIQANKSCIDLERLENYQRGGNMPRKKKVVEDVTTVAVVEPEEQQLRKHIVQIRKKQILVDLGVTIERPVGEIIYWESTDDVTYSCEAGHQIYMDNLVGRAIKIPPQTWIPREQTRKWLENMPQAMLDDGYCTSEVLSMYETE
jgi:hypothetical protein